MLLKNDIFILEHNLHVSLRTHSLNTGLLMNTNTILSPDLLVNTTVSKSTYSSLDTTYADIPNPRSGFHFIFCCHNYNSFIKIASLFCPTKLTKVSTFQEFLIIENVYAVVFFTCVYKCFCKYVFLFRI